MIVETGHFALVLALCIAAVQATIPMIGAHLRNQTWMSLAVPAALTQFLLLVVSFAALTHAFVTSDLKYHDYFKAENKILLVDIGHYESEQYTKNLIFNFLTKKIPNFAIVLSKTNTNPIMYS